MKSSRNIAISIVVVIAITRCDVWLNGQVRISLRIVEACMGSMPPAGMMPYEMTARVDYLCSSQRVDASL